MPRSLETARGLCTIAACGHYGLEQLCAVALALSFATMTKVCVCMSVCLCVCVSVSLYLCLCALGGGQHKTRPSPYTRRVRRERRCYVSIISVRDTYVTCLRNDAIALRYTTIEGWGAADGGDHGALETHMLHAYAGAADGGDPGAARSDALPNPRRPSPRAEGRGRGRGGGRGGRQAAGREWGCACCRVGGWCVAAARGGRAVVRRVLPGVAVAGVLDTCSLP